MDWFRIVYYIAIIIALSLCIRVTVSGYDKNVRVFIPLLLISILIESISDYMASKGEVKMLLYHLFIPIEYFFISTYYFKVLRGFSIARIIIRISFVLLALVSLWMSFGLKGTNSFPGIQYNIAGILNITLALGLLSLLPVQDETPVYELPVFWISIGLIMYHSTIFVLNGSYNYLAKINDSYTAKLSQTINYIVNLLYYMCFSIGFICCMKKKKS